MIELSPNTPDEAAQVLASITAPSALADFLAANLQADVTEKQRMLEELNVEARLRMIAARLATQRRWRRSSLSLGLRRRSCRRWHCRSIP